MREAERPLPGYEDAVEVAWKAITLSTPPALSAVYDALVQTRDELSKAVEEK